MKLKINYGQCYFCSFPRPTAISINFLMLTTHQWFININSYQKFDRVRGVLRIPSVIYFTDGSVAMCQNFRTARKTPVWMMISLDVGP